MRLHIRTAVKRLHITTSVIRLMRLHIKNQFWDYILQHQVWDNILQHHYDITHNIMRFHITTSLWDYTLQQHNEIRHCNITLRLHITTKWDLRLHIYKSVGQPTLLARAVALSGVRYSTENNIVATISDIVIIRNKVNVAFKKNKRP